jgi:isopentenyl-diphosphate delta-isomerase type 1
MRAAMHRQATGYPQSDAATDHHLDPVMGARPDEPSDARPHGPVDDPDEVFDLVDADDRVIGRVRRGDAHRDPALLHRSVQILIFADDGQLLLQRRSAAKDLFPGYWCASASGHVASGEDYATTATREVEEELGVAPKLVYVGKTLVRSEQETEITAFFLARCDGPFAFSPRETDGGAFFTREELRSHRRDPSLPLTPAAEAALDELDRLERDGLLARYLDEL